MPKANPIAQESAAHAKLNRSTRDAWQRYARHREQVMGLLGELGGDRLALLGAGNCNDVDLAELLLRFEALTLVDLDMQACRQALAKLDEEAHARAQVVRVDLGGVLERLTRFAKRPPRDEQLRALPEQAVRGARKAMPQPFDVVLSAGVLSQLVWSCTQRLTLKHPALRAIALTAMMGHISIVLDRTRPGGTALLAVDTVARPPEVMDELAAQMSPMDMLVAFERRRGCLPATEATVVANAVRHVCPGADVSLSEPWLWRIADHRSSLVYALVIRKPAE